MPHHYHSVRWTPEEDQLLLAAVLESWNRNYFLSWVDIETYMQSHGSNRKANQAHGRYTRLIARDPCPCPIAAAARAAAPFPPFPAPIAQGVPVVFAVVAAHAVVNV